MTPRFGAVVPAAGKGERLGGRHSKAFVPLAGRPLVLHALQTLQRTPIIGWIVVVVRPQDRARMERLVRASGLTKVSAVVPGGASRAASVAQGVATLPPGVRWVLIHDAARPCVSPSLIRSVVTRTRRFGAAACGLQASVTVKAADRTNMIRLTLDRERLWFMQTPQAFRRDWFSDSLARVDGEGDGMPDDVALLEWAGFPVRVVPGDPLNIKVTTKDDLLLAEAILRTRVKMGDERVKG